MIQTQENGKNSHFRPNLGSLDPNSGCQTQAYGKLRPELDIMVNYHHVQYKKKLMIQS